MENKQQRPLFLGFSSQKGGVGKSTLAEIVSSILYYEQGINLFVVDCDLSQDSFYKLREREKSVIQGSEELGLAVWSTKVNCPINIVKYNEPKVLTGSNQKGKQSAVPLNFGDTRK